MRKPLILILALLLSLGLISCRGAETKTPGATEDAVVTTDAPEEPETPPEETTEESAPEIEITQMDGITYINGILIANKTHGLPADYDPGIDAVASSALAKMQMAAAEEGIELFVVSGYRSYSYQQNLYNNYVARDGQAAADRYSARPGYSEHQTGLAFDLNSLEESFGETREGIWLKEHCYEYGFIIRYPKEKEAETGYMYEPWHVRYLGEDLAKQVYESGLCLEEYLDITSVYAD